MYLCSMKRMWLIGLTVLLLGLTACERGRSLDRQRQSVADRLNKEAFVNRYRDPQGCIALSEEALAYIADSLPEYGDGVLRAHNDMAFAYYQMSDHEGAERELAQVERALANPTAQMHNADIEGAIAQLLRARLLQRACRIADSYRLLYDIGRSRTLEHNRDNVLYNYAQTEYYITMLVLNFHYRQGKEARVEELLEEVESRREELRVDFAQDMALNYALAYGYQSIGESLTALDYCDDNFGILERVPGAWCAYHYANTLQMTALALKSLPGMVSPDSVLALYDSARVAFFSYGDPYQMLGGVTSTARYALLCGDTARAHEVLGQWLNMRNTWTPFTAPKMEVGFFDLLLRSRMARDGDQARRWYEHQTELQEHIQQGEREDFALQQTLAESKQAQRWLTAAAVLFGAMVLMLTVLAVLLVRQTRRLRREKHELEQAKQRDVERIANVETCLSVIRHDVSPFISYLQKTDLPTDLREEVLSQLSHTFDNIKNWTRLSIPTGLAFRAEVFALQEVLEAVRGQVMRPHAGVELRIRPTTLSVHGDRQLVIILLRNLTTNALQHTTQGYVELEAQSDGKMVDILVRDTGSGMSDEERESLFRADRKPQGDHGFGLILCRYIIKKHDDMTCRGCSLHVESHLGKGTTMHVRLARGDTSQ